MGGARDKTMTLAADEFMRRFLLHVLPTGLHRIRHYGLLANAGRQQNLATARALLDVPRPEPVDDESAVTPPPTFVRRCSCGDILVVEITLRRAPVRDSAR